MSDPIPQLQLHQIRVVEEKAELDSKLNRLREFIDSHKFSQLSPSECSLLIRQAAAMTVYSEVLSQRIALWTRK